MIKYSILEFIKFYDIYSGIKLKTCIVRLKVIKLFYIFIQNSIIGLWFSQALENSTESENSCIISVDMLAGSEGRSQSKYGPYGRLNRAAVWRYFNFFSPGQKTARQLFLHFTCMLANHLDTLGITILTMPDRSSASPLRDD